MIRVDYKKDDKGNVNTTWVKEDGDRHSMMGRLLFDEADFDMLEAAIEDAFSGSQRPYPIRFEQKG